MSIKNCCCGDTAVPGSSSVPMFPVAPCNNMNIPWESSCNPFSASPNAKVFSIRYLPSSPNIVAVVTGSPPSVWLGGAVWPSPMLHRVTISGDIATLTRINKADGFDLSIRYRFSRSTADGIFTSYINATYWMEEVTMTIPGKTITARYEKTGTCSARLVLSDQVQATTNANAWCSGWSLSLDARQLHYEALTSSMPSTVTMVGSYDEAKDPDMCLSLRDVAGLCGCWACKSTRNASYLVQTMGTWIVPLISFTQIDGVVTSFDYKWTCPSGSGSFTPSGNSRTCASAGSVVDSQFRGTVLQSLLPGKKEVHYGFVQSSTNRVSSTCPGSGECGLFFSQSIFFNEWSWNPFDIIPSRYGARVIPKGDRANGGAACTGAGQDPCNGSGASNYTRPNFSDTWSSERCGGFLPGFIQLACLDEGRLTGKCLQEGLYSSTLTVS
jgi:hypothetical protein